MINEEKNDCLIKFFFEGQINVSLLRSLFLKIDELSHSLYDKEILKISYAGIGIESNKSKTLNYNKKNLDNFYSSLNDFKVGSVEIFSLSSGSKMSSRDTLISMSIFFPNEFSNVGSLVLQFEFLKDFKISDIVDISIKLSETLFKRDLKLIQGFSFIMNRMKNPKFFAQGIGNPNLSILEKNLLKKWPIFTKQLEFKILDIFLINILPQKHLAYDFFKGLPDSFDEKSTTFTKNDISFFYFPKTTKLDMNNYHKFQAVLRRKLESNKLFIQHI